MQKKYEFTGETKIWCGVALKRIRASIDFTLKCGIKIPKGEEGGWIEKEDNLSHEDSSWVYGNAWVYGDARVCGDAEVCGDARVYGDAWVCGYARVYGDANVFGNARVCGDAKVSGNAKVSGDAKVFGNAKVSGDAKVFGNAWVSGYAKVSGNAWVERLSDVIWFKNIWSSGRTFTYTRSNGKWEVGCFHGTGAELIKKAYADSKVSGRCYEAIVRATEAIYKAIEDKEETK